MSEIVQYLRSVVESGKGIKMLLVNLALELFGDAVREFVVVFNPPPPLCVLDGYSCYACGKQ